MNKLTLSADAKVIKLAKKIAHERGTSVSALFSDFIQALSVQRVKSEVGPLTRRATGLIKLPKNKTDRQLIEEALSEKYGL